jgi:hypothetical protein
MDLSTKWTAIGTQFMDFYPPTTGCFSIRTDASPPQPITHPSLTQAASKKKHSSIIMPSGWAGLAASVLRGGQQQQQQPPPPPSQQEEQREDKSAPMPPPPPLPIGAYDRAMMGEVRVCACVIRIELTWKPRTGPNRIDPIGSIDRSIDQHAIQPHPHHHPNHDEHNRLATPHNSPHRRHTPGRLPPPTHHTTPP